MNKNVDFAEQVRTLKNGGQITLGLSKTARSSNVANFGFFFIFGLFSVLYWIERSVVHKQLALLVGPAGLPRAGTILDVVFGFGALGVFMIPFTVQALLHPAQIIINKSAVIFKSGQRTKDMRWDQVIDITRYPPGVEQDDSIHEIEKITVHGKNGRIIVESTYDISTDGLLDLLNACWDACADKKSFLAYAELNNSIAKNSPEARAFDEIISSLRLRRNENEAVAASIQRILVGLCLGLAVAAGVVYFFRFIEMGHLQ